MIGPGAAISTLLMSPEKLGRSYAHVIKVAIVTAQSS